MDPITMALIMAGTGLATNELNNDQIRKQNAAQSKIAAAQTRYSPWTGNAPGQFNPTAQKSSVGAALQGAASGASFSQNYEAAQNQNEFNKLRNEQMRMQNQVPWLTNAKVIGNTHNMAGGYQGYQG